VEEIEDMVIDYLTEKFSDRVADFIMELGAENIANWLESIDVQIAIESPFLQWMIDRRLD